MTWHTQWNYNHTVTTLRLEDIDTDVARQILHRYICTPLLLYTGQKETIFHIGRHQHHKAFFFIHVEGSHTLKTQFHFASSNVT